ncbi:MAG: hypothetical protein HYR91_04165 [Flavobacteriia bacterium]|nr:hypothetical protein [Flavobacteriia bacterium]
MTDGLAIEIAKKKMLELEVGENYLLRFRHLVLIPDESRIVKAPNDILILLLPDENIRVVSKTGAFDLTDKGISEMQYVYSGTITIQNLNQKLPVHVKLLQVIPKIK